MTTCPACGYKKNIEGADVCDKCQTPLADLSNRQPDSPIERSILKDRIRTLYPHPPLIVSPQTPVAEVLRQMVEHKTGCAVVVRDEQVIGIFSDRDAVMRLNTEAATLAQEPIERFMTPNPETLELEDKIAFALHKMDLGGFRHLPILNQGRTVGILSARDILRYLNDGLLAAEEA